MNIPTAKYQGLSKVLSLCQTRVDQNNLHLCMPHLLHSSPTACLTCFMPSSAACLICFMPSPASYLICFMPHLLHTSPASYLTRFIPGPFTFIFSQSSSNVKQRMSYTINQTLVCNFMNFCLAMILPTQLIGHQIGYQ